MPAPIRLLVSKHIFHFSAEDSVEVEHAPIVHLSAHLKAAGPTEWLWCQHCERSFQAEAARRDGDLVACGYADCAGSAIDFWSWRAHRAFVGVGPEVPEVHEPGQRYPLVA